MGKPSTIAMCNCQSRKIGRNCWLNRLCKVSMGGWGTPKPYTILCRKQMWWLTLQGTNCTGYWGDIGRLWPYSLFLRFEVKKIGSQVTKCAWSPTPVTQKWCVPFVVACDPIRARSIIFEGSLAEKLRFWVSQLHFWRKSRRKASF